MNGKPRLELNWIGKNERPRLEPRILVEQADKSYYAATKKSSDIFDNILIHGDNLLALRAIDFDPLSEIKCIAHNLG